MLDIFFDFIQDLYTAAPIPLRMAYGCWAFFLFIYGFAYIYDEYHQKKERVVKIKNFPFTLYLIGGFVALFYHGSLTWGWGLSFPMQAGEYSPAFLIFGFLFMIPGFLLVSFGRATLNGFWGPDIYEYLNEGDNMLIKTRIYSHIRHPIYFGQFLMATATVFFSNSWIVIAFPVLLTMLNIVRARREDKDLEERFGEHFRKYRDGVYFMFWPIW